MLSLGVAAMIASLHPGRLFNTKGLWYFTHGLILLAHFRKAVTCLKEEHVIKSFWSSPEPEILVKGFLLHNTGGSCSHVVGEVLVYIYLYL